VHLTIAGLQSIALAGECGRCCGRIVKQAKKNKKTKQKQKKNLFFFKKKKKIISNTNKTKQIAKK
jgi:hypothetical protein